MANTATLDIAREVRHRLAGSALTERQAKLYSQRLRRDMGREGLASFVPGDIDAYLDEAMLLLECALLERGADPTSAWRRHQASGRDPGVAVSAKPEAPQHAFASSRRGRLPARRLSRHGARPLTPRAGRSALFRFTP
jgi:hypothetical protein